MVGGPDFGELTGNTLTIGKALYGICSSGLCWHQPFADVLRKIGFFQRKAEADIWMK